MQQTKQRFLIALERPELVNSLAGDLLKTRLYMYQWAEPAA